MSKLSKNILEKIKKEHIKPKPKWYFILMHSLLWSSVLVSIFLGAMATAIILRHSMTTDWMVMHHVAGGKMCALMMSLPYLWFAFIGLVLFLANKLFKHTKTGYRAKPSLIIVFSILISITFGSLFYAIKLDHPFENKLRKHLPHYEQRKEQLAHKMVNPDKGVIAGEITDIDLESELILIDFKGWEWKVDIQNIQQSLKLGAEVGIFGKKTGEDTFKAERIKPLKRSVKK